MTIHNDRYAVGTCPSCRSFRSVYLVKNCLKCDSCEFLTQLLCVYCSVGELRPLTIGMECSYCKSVQTSQQLAYILENRLKVSTDERCQFCNSPTLSKYDANIMPRCFDYPNCANQSMLFPSSKPVKSLVFLDFETTGLEIGSESIIELGACKVDDTGKEYFFQEFVKPVQDIKPLITSITGIDNNMVADAPSLRQVLDAFMVFCGSANIVAHNAQFDVPWLLTSLMRHGHSIPFKDVLCTLKWAKKIEDGKRSLGALSKKYGIGHENAHRALADAVVTKSLYYIYEKVTPDPPFESMDRYIEISTKICDQFKDFIQP